MESKFRYFLHPQRSFDLNTFHSHFNSCLKYCDENEVPGMLVSTSAGDFYDPWMMAQNLLHQTKKTSPVIAINPAYIHPFYAARMVDTLSALYHRKIFLNFVIGSNLTDLHIIGDHFAHDERYQRMDEFIHIFSKLIYSRSKFSFSGKYFNTENISLLSKLNPELLPEFFISGHSLMSVNLAKKYNVLNIQMLNLETFTGNLSDKICALTLVCRETEEEVDTFISKQFPKDRFGEIMYQRAMAKTDSEWKLKIHDEAVQQKKNKLFRTEPVLYNYTGDPCLAGTKTQIADFFKPLKERGLKNYLFTFYESEDLNNFKEIISN